MLFFIAFYYNRMGKTFKADIWSFQRASSIYLCVKYKICILKLFFQSVSKIMFFDLIPSRNLYVRKGDTIASKTVRIPTRPRSDGYKLT